MKTTIDHTVICPVCDGSPLEEHPFRKEAQLCGFCKGKRSVSIEKEDHYWYPNWLERLRYQRSKKVFVRSTTRALANQGGQKELDDFQVVCDYSGFRNNGFTSSVPSLIYDYHFALGSGKIISPYKK